MNTLQNGDKIEFNILTAQALNLSVEALNGGSDQTLEELFGFYFDFLLEKRNDHKLQAKFLRARQKAEQQKELKEKERDSATNDFGQE